MPTNNQIARQMAQFGRREAKALGALERAQTALERVHKERCEYLQSLMDGADLSGDVTTFSVAPKDRR